MKDLTVPELQQQVGALVIQLWAEGKHVALLEKRVADLTPKTEPPPPVDEPPKE